MPLSFTAGSRIILNPGQAAYNQKKKTASTMFDVIIIFSSCFVSCYLFIVLANVFLVNFT